MSRLVRALLTGALFGGFLVLSAAGVTLPAGDSQGGVRNSEWSMFRHDAHHSGYSTTEAPGKGDILWTQELALGNEVRYCSPAVVAGRLYISSDAGFFCCLNAYTGESIWMTQGISRCFTGYERSSPVLGN